MLVPRVYKLAQFYEPKSKKVTHREIRVYIGDELVETVRDTEKWGSLIDNFGGKRIRQEARQRLKERFKDRIKKKDFDENDELVLFTEDELIREVMARDNFINEPNRKR